jgi:hypothetical protein
VGHPYCCLPLPPPPPTRPPTCCVLLPAPPHPPTCCCLPAPQAPPPGSPTCCCLPASLPPPTTQAHPPAAACLPFPPPAAACLPFPFPPPAAACLPFPCQQTSPTHLLRAAAVAGGKALADVLQEGKGDAAAKPLHVCVCHPASHPVTFTLLCGVCQHGKRFSLLLRQEGVVPSKSAACRCWGCCGYVALAVQLFNTRC